MIRLERAGRSAVDTLRKLVWLNRIYCNAQMPPAMNATEKGKRLTWSWRWSGRCMHVRVDTWGGLIPD